MQWFTPRNDPDYVSKSADGYYAVSAKHPGEFMAHHIDAVWARPREIGLANTLAGAQDVCEQHLQGRAA